MSRIQTLYFDFDGTLQNTLGMDHELINEVYDEIHQEYGYPVEHIDAATVKRWLGHKPQEMWHEFLPGVPEKIKREANDRIGVHLRDRILKGGAPLFDDVPETLKILKDAGKTLIVLSNCYHEYMETVRKAHRLDEIFDDFLCAEDCGWKHKAEILAEDCKCRPGGYLMAGDRREDVEAGRRNGILSVFCAYGAGTPEEGAEADVRIDAFREILKLPGIMSEK